MRFYNTNKYLMTITIVLSLFGTSVFAKTHTVDQVDRSFKIKGNTVSAININVGDKIIFANKDSVFHNIFSMSDISKFNFGAFGNGESKSIVFSKAGKSTVECAIHPRMVLEVNVSK